MSATKVLMHSHQAPASPALLPGSLWLRTLRHRPLLWLAPCIAAGCALGPLVAAWCRFERAASLLLLLWIVAGIALFGAAWLARGARSAVARLTLALALLVGGAAHSARRISPPAGDVAWLVRAAAIPAGPQKRVPVVLEGWVADYPRRGDFNVEFPLDCRQVTANGRTNERHGRVWVEAPLDVPVEVGQPIAVSAELADLPRAGNVGERTSPMRWILDNCWCRARVKKKTDVRALPWASRYGAERRIASLRRRLIAHYENAFAGANRAFPARPYPRATAQLLAAMVFGEGGLQEPLPRSVRDDFRAAGLSHVLVASGAQVSFLAIFLLGGAALLGLRRWAMIIPIFAALLFFALLTGGAASIWRATIGGLCVAWALLLGRDVDGLSLWSLAFGALILIDPAQLWGLSFQLTFAATWGLLALAPSLRRLPARAAEAQKTRDQEPAQDDNATAWAAMGVGTVRTDRNFGLDLIALSLGAQLATLPLVLFHFGRLSASGLGVNLLAVPLAGVLVGTGVLGLVLPLANLVNYPLTRGMMSLASLAAAAPGAQVQTVPVRLQWTLLLYLGLLLAAAYPALKAGVQWSVLREEWRRWKERRMGRQPHRWQGAATMLVCILSALWAWRTLAAGQAQLSVTVLDVGQGESILVRAPSGRAVLIDGGTLAPEERGEAGRAIIVPYLQAMGVAKLDALVITHADADHCNALPAVLREVPVGLVIDGAADAGILQADHENVRQMLRSRGVPTHAARPGQTLNLGDGAVLTVLAPQSPPLQSENNNAAVLRLDYGATSVLLTADIEREAEERLVRRGVDLHCTVLKVAHHGSKTSTSPLFLAAARPQAAVLSCGRYNPFGHPAPATLQHLAERHIPTFRTDLQGAVTIESDGRTCWIQTYR